MAKKPFFSIIIPTYNRALSLQFALYCIFQQNFLDFEVVVSDNCSTDNTGDIISKLKNKKIHYFRNKINLKLALNIKNAMSHARGKYIFLHSDDDLLPYSDSLQKIYNEVVKSKAGYVRVNYMCLSPDKKKLFYLNVNNPFKENEYLQPFSENKKILEFIVNSDTYFITGIIFKNILPTNIKIVDADPVPWIEILFYVTEKFGAYFMAERNIVASWSQWIGKKNRDHPVYSLVNGKLKPENYFKAVENKVDGEEYNIFLHNQLMLIFVYPFPVIKVIMGNKNLLNLSKRICFLDPTMKKSVIYWACLGVALIFPKNFLKFIKNICLFLYTRFPKGGNDKEIVSRLRELDYGFSHARKNVLGRKDLIFKF